MNRRESRGGKVSRMNRRESRGGKVSSMNRGKVGEVKYPVYE